MRTASVSGPRAARGSVCSPALFALVPAPHSGAGPCADNAGLQQRAGLSRAARGQFQDEPGSEHAMCSNMQKHTFTFFAPLGCGCQLQLVRARVAPLALYSSRFVRLWLKRCNSNTNKTKLPPPQLVAAALLPGPTPCARTPARGDKVFSLVHTHAAPSATHRRPPAQRRARRRAVQPVHVAIQRRQMVLQGNECPLFLLILQGIF